MTMRDQLQKNIRDNLTCFAKQRLKKIKIFSMLPLMTCFWVKLMMHKIIFLLMLLSSLFYDSLLFARYHGRRAITDISEKTINFINETNFDCLVVAKMYHCPNKTACVSCNLKSNKKHTLSSHDRIMLSYPLPKKTP